MIKRNDKLNEYHKKKKELVDQLTFKTTSHSPEGPLMRRG